MIPRFIALCALLGIVATVHAQPDLVKRGASITLKVESFPDAQQAVADLATKYEGSVADRSVATSEKGRDNGWMRVHVPKAALDQFLADVRGQGKLFGENLTYSDGSQMYADLGSRSTRLQEHAARLQSILNSRKLRGSDMLFVQERILRTSVDQDSLTQQREAIPRQAASSSVIVTLFEPSEIEDLPRTPLGHVREAFTSAIKNIAQGLLRLLEPLIKFLIWALVLGVAWLALRKRLKAIYQKIVERFDNPSNPPNAEPGESPTTEG